MLANEFIIHLSEDLEIEDWGLKIEKYHVLS